MMNYEFLSPKDFLKNSNIQINPTKEDLKKFSSLISDLLQKTDPNESEENHKNKINKFLEKAFGYDINTDGRIDSVIKVDEEVQVIIEVKNLKNKAEFPKSKDSLDSKAFCESILYYLREFKNEKNNNIKHIILCNLNSFYIIDAKEYHQKFAQDDEILKFFKNTDKKQGNDTSTKKFYEEIQNYLQTLEAQISYTYFDLRNENDHPLIYAILSPTCLLKQKKFIDTNILNQDFYDELLHILGLCEKIEEGKVIIIPSDTQNSLLKAIVQDLNLDEKKDFEDIFSLITTWNNRILFLRLLESMLISFEHFDSKHSDRGFLNIEVIPDFKTLDTLFFKVLAKQENQRENIPEKLKSIPYLNSSLFDETDLEKGKKISSLSSNELLLHPRSILKKDPDSPYKRKSSLPLLEYLFAFLNAYDFTTTPKDIQNDTKININKLINSAVLGLVFEKLNGYKDGSFYTPSFITGYMCETSITKAVIDKFNAAKGWNCKTLVDIYNKIDNIKEANEIFNTIRICDTAVGSGHYLVSALNQLILIKHQLDILCDESNRRIRDINLELINDEIIIKSEGKIFTYCIPAQEQTESHKIQKALFNAKKDLIENCLFGVDINPNSCEITKLRLWIELLKYSYYKDIENRHLETLPNIDINIKCGNSLISNIDLRITQESLYKQFSKGINKERNLLNQGYTDEIANDLQNNFQIKFKEYAQAVQSYKNETDKDLKGEWKKTINECQKFLSNLFKKSHPISIKFYEVLKDYTEQYGNEGFNVSPQDCKVSQENLKKLWSFLEIFDPKRAWDTPRFGENNGSDYKKLQNLQNLMNQYNQLFESGAFEWRFAFPEVLDENGDFIGFDVVIGNPPYIRQERIKDIKPHLSTHFEVYSGTSDIFTYFFELGYKISKNKGYVSLITSNKWTRAGYGKKLREFILTKTKLETYVEFNGVSVFDSATVDTSILEFQKISDTNQASHDFKYIAISEKPQSGHDISQIQPQMIDTSTLSSEAFTFGDSKSIELKQKIESMGVPLKDWDINIYRGILTGYNEAFIIDTPKREEILSNCDNTPKSALPFKKLGEQYIKYDGEIQKDEEIKYLNERERTDQIIRPILRGRDIKRYSYEWANKWVIVAKFGSHKYIESDYPTIYHHLQQYKNKLMARGQCTNSPVTDKKPYPGQHHWLELDNNPGYDYMSEFYRQKISWQRVTQEPSFILEKNFVILDSMAFFVSNSEKNLKYLLGVLNSRLIFYYFKNIGHLYSDKGFLLSNQYVERLPVPEIPESDQEKFIKIVDEILENKANKQDTQALEDRLDTMVYELYGLSDEEISIIESSFKTD